MRRRIEITLLMWICTCCLLVAHPLAGQLDSLLSVTPLMRTSEAGIAVYDLTAGTSVYRYQADKLYRPASVEKVITSVTALSVLGTGYTFRTQLAYTGTIEQDTLKGDLYVIGGFDPEFMESDLVRLADAAGQAGIRVIKGRLVGDISLMDSVYWGPGWSWDDTPESFQPYLSPLMLNRGCVDITVSPSAKGKPAKVTVLPQSDYYELDNRTLSRTPSAGKLRITRNWLTNGNRIILTGNVTGPYTRTLNLFDSSAFFMQSFWKRLQTRAVEISPDSIAYGVCPDEASRLYIHERPLDAVLKRALKKSDNLSAEALFYHVGLNDSRDKRSISNADGQRAIRLFMEKSVGISPEDFRIADGSGVSLYNYVSPDLLMAYLRYAYAHPEVFRPFYDALPVAGVDGTLSYRMRGGKAFRNVHAKTGTVTGVSSLAGYVHASNGHLLAFVIINQNVLKSREARTFQDRFCEILAR
ncbi:D-alanyl-D-alanine carboxypeptidase/D-alanyl-D-alanine endopeptidase [Phocaeicola coprophilus]